MGYFRAEAMRDYPGSVDGVDSVDSVDSVSRKLPSAEPFPVDALPGPCRKLAREAAAAISCPPDLVAVPMLVTLGSAIGNSRVVKLKGGWEEGATLYGAAIADPGEKKTPALKEAVRPAMKQQAALRNTYREKQDEYKRECREYEVERKDAAKQGIVAPPPPEEPTMQRTVVEDTTVEALAVVLEGNPRGVLAIRDELAGWVHSMNQYKSAGKGADRQFWLSAWSNSEAVVDRKSRGEPLMLPRPFASVFGSIQPGVLPELGQGREDGLLDRFLFATRTPYPRGGLTTKLPSQPEPSTRVYTMGYAIYTCERTSTATRTPCASCWHRTPNRYQHREEMEPPGFPARLKGPWSKLEGYIARLCLILATARAVDGSTAERVEVDDVLRALVLLDYFKSHARRVYVGLYGENEDDRLAEDLIGFLKERGGYFKDEPAELHAQLESEYKPDRPAELTKQIKRIAARTPLLKVAEGTFRKEGKPRRFLELTLETAVDAVDAVDIVNRAHWGRA